MFDGAKLFVYSIYWAKKKKKEAPRSYIPILFESIVSEIIFLIKYEHYNV